MLFTQNLVRGLSNGVTKDNQRVLGLLVQICIITDLGEENH
jgi:hypothetical protein